VDWAQSLGITSRNGNGGFSPNANITREQLVTMLYRYVQIIGADSGKSASIASFSDSGNVSSYAQTAMQWAVAEGIITGTGNNQLSPQGNATRAQVAAVLTRFVDRLAAQKQTSLSVYKFLVQKLAEISQDCGQFSSKKHKRNL